jgi:hypothetical protein
MWLDGRAARSCSDDSQLEATTGTDLHPQWVNELLVVVRIG